MPVPSLPPEITDTIISAVDNRGQEGRRTLLACCLVCHAWLQASRTNLFEYIVITGNWHRYTLLVDTVLHSDTMSRYLASSRTLVLLDNESSWRYSRLPTFVFQFLIEFAGRLTGLRELTLSDLRLDEYVPYSRWPLLFSHFPTITSLDLWDCRFYSPVDLRRMLAALQSLQELTILDPTWRSSETRQQLCLTSRAQWPALHYLDLRLTHISQSTVIFARWIAKSLVGSPLKTLKCYYPLHVASDSLQEVAATLFDLVGRSVTYLVVDRVSSLERFTALENLCLDFISLEAPEKWENVAPMLRSLSSPTIRSAEFDSLRTRRWYQKERTPMPDSTALFDQAELGVLDPILTGESFGSLEEVMINIQAHKEDQQELFEAHAQRYLPKLLERKIVRLDIQKW